jgi:chitodextrinase
VWTAPGDDSLLGQATRYDLRWSLTPITTLADFALATPVSGVAAPAIAGSTESATVSGLTPATQYWFALRTQDDAGNLSDISNIVTGSTLVSTDSTRPAPVPSRS